VGTNISPHALCKIDSARDFELSSWKANFCEASLSENDAEQLLQLLLAEMTPEQWFIHLAVTSASSSTSTGSAGSIRYREQCFGIRGTGRVRQRGQIMMIIYEFHVYIFCNLSYHILHMSYMFHNTIALLYRIEGCSYSA
jgi:hypothetical protein